MGKFALHCGVEGTPMSHTIANPTTESRIKKTQLQTQSGPKSISESEYVGCHTTTTAGNVINLRLNDHIWWYQTLHCVCSLGTSIELLNYYIGRKKRIHRYCEPSEA